MELPKDPVIAFHISLLACAIIIAILIELFFYFVDRDYCIVLKRKIPCLHSFDYNDVIDLKKEPKCTKCKKTLTELNNDKEP